LPAAGFSERLGQITVIAAAVTAAGGLGLLAAGARPAEALHFVYAALALAAIPTVNAVTRQATRRGQAMATAAAAALLVVLIARLYTTG
jgi:hypothetical protein